MRLASRRRRQVAEHRRHGRNSGCPRRGAARDRTSARREALESLAMMHFRSGLADRQHQHIQSGMREGATMLARSNTKTNGHQRRRRVGRGRRCAGLRRVFSRFARRHGGRGHEDAEARSSNACAASAPTCQSRSHSSHVPRCAAQHRYALNTSMLRRGCKRFFQPNHYARKRTCVTYIWLPRFAVFGHAPRARRSRARLCRLCARHGKIPGRVLAAALLPGFHMPIRLTGVSAVVVADTCARGGPGRGANRY